VVSNFDVQAQTSPGIEIYSDSSQIMSFCYIDELLEAMVLTMHTGYDFIGPVNIGRPGEFSMLEPAELVLKLTGPNSKIVFKPLPQNDPERHQPDVSLTKSVLNWEPKVRLKVGLREKSTYFKANF
jgi:UDP-glucuronate decarboxylase